MELTKTELKMLIQICSGESTREGLAKQLAVTPNRISYLLVGLNDKDFINTKVKNRKLIISPAKTEHVHLFKKLLILESGTKYEEFLFGFNFRLLSYCLFSWKTSRSIAQQLEITEKTVLNRTALLRRRQLLNKQKKGYCFNKQAWSVLFEFLSACRNYEPELNNILWKFEDEIVQEVAELNKYSTPTGFSAYTSLGIPINLIKHAVFSPKEKLSKEEIFIHSLLQIRKETRLLDLAVVFYKKYRLNKNKLCELAMKYDCSEKLDDFITVLKTTKGRVTTQTLPITSAQGMAEMLKIYRVKI